MGTRIEAIDGPRLKLSGDIETTLDLPFRAVREGFGLAFSDGTLIRGGYDFAGQKCRFALAIEGAGEVSITRTDGHEALQLDWPIDWISVAAGDDLICANELSAPESAQLALEMDGVHAA